MKTFTAKPHEVVHGWYLVNAEGKVLGRLASQIAARLRGKHKPEYTPHVDTGDYIVVVNASKIRVTGKKALDKKYYRHTSYPGGIRVTNFAKLQRASGSVLEKAEKGMLPKGRSARDAEETEGDMGRAASHTAQQPKALEV